MSSPSIADGSRPDAAISRLRRSPFMYWALLSLLWLVLALIGAAQTVAWREIDWKSAFGFALMDWGPWIVLSPLVLWFARRVQIDGHNWPRTVPLHIAGALVIAVAAQLMAQTAAEYGLIPGPEGGFGPPGPGERRFVMRIAGPPADGRGPPPAHEPREPREPPANLPRFIRARFSIPIYCVIVAAAHAIAYHRRSLERERRALAAEARLTEARLMALQTQLNPHFLFNTLNAVSSLVYTQPQAADEMICSLSELLRRVLAVSERREVTLAEELDFVERYLNIQRIRFADRLEVQRTIVPGVELASVPTLILQPLVENAIIHGVAPRPGKGTVILSAAAQGNRLVLEVRDTGPGTPSEAKVGEPLPPQPERVGLSNIRARLAALYGHEGYLTLTRAAEGGMCARIELPLRLPASA